jgi:hypothetical protein
VSDLDRPMRISLWAMIAHSSFIEGSHTTKNTASDYLSNEDNVEKVRETNRIESYFLTNELTSKNAAILNVM